MNTLKATLYTLLKARVGAETLIEADQNAARPALPYWTWRLQSMPSIGSDSYSQGTTSAGDQTVNGVREGTINLQRYGDDSEITVAGVRDDFAKVSVMQSWQQAKLALIRLGPVQNVPIKLDNSKFEARASLDIFIRFGTKLLDRVGFINVVEIGGEYPDTAAEDVPDQITVTDPD